jgi:hypothetical protein
MTTLITVYHSGLIITNEIGSYEFVGMKKETFLLNEFRTLENLVDLVREKLSWMDEGSEVPFEGQLDIGSSNDPQIKMMTPMCNEKEWTAYVRVVMKSEIHMIELVVVARMVGQNDVGDESCAYATFTLSEAIDVQGVECDVVLMQPSQETQDDIDADEPPFVGNNETMLNVEPIS